MDVLDLLKQLNSWDEVPSKLAALSTSQLNSLYESFEYYLLAYPQGTGNAELEDLLGVLSEYFDPEDEE